MNKDEYQERLRQVLRLPGCQGFMSTCRGVSWRKTKVIHYKLGKSYYLIHRFKLLEMGKAAVKHIWSTERILG